MIVAFMLQSSEEKLRCVLKETQEQHEKELNRIRGTCTYTYEYSLILIR